MKIGSVEILREYTYKDHYMIAEVTDGNRTGWVCEAVDDMADLRRNGIRNIIGTEEDARAEADRLDAELQAQLSEESGEEETA